MRATEESAIISAISNILIIENYFYSKTRRAQGWGLPKIYLFLYVTSIMRCPKCDSPMASNSLTCRYCGARIVRQPTEVNQDMSNNGRICLISGVLLILIAGTLALYDIWFFGSITFVVGAILLGIGKLMD